MDSRTKLLLGVLAFVGLLAVWTWVGPGGGEDAAPTPAAGAYDEAAAPTPRVLPGARRGATAAKPPEQVEELRVAALAIRPREYTPGRDPWRFVDPPPPPRPPPPPPPAPPSAAELERQRLAQEALERQRAAAAAEAAKPKPPPFTMSYLGNFGPPSRRLAVFSDGKTIYNAQKGEVLAGKFIVAEIGYESVDIRFVGFPDWPPQRLAVGPGGR
jgi:hypothetical protein